MGCVKVDRHYLRRSRSVFGFYVEEEGVEGADPQAVVVRSVAGTEVARRVRRSAADACRWSGDRELGEVVVRAIRFGPRYPLPVWGPG
jgi:hypothetical protein